MAFSALFWTRAYRKAVLWLGKMRAEPLEAGKAGILAWQLIRLAETPR